MQVMIKLQEQYLAKLKAIHHLCETTSSNKGHLPLGVLEAMGEFWGKMADLGVAAERSWEAISLKLWLLGGGEHTGEKSIPQLVDGQLVMDVMLRTTFCRTATSDAKKLKLSFSESILERERIQAEMEVEEIQRKKTEAEKTLQKIKEAIEYMEKTTIGGPRAILLQLEAGERRVSMAVSAMQAKIIRL